MMMSKTDDTRRAEMMDELRRYVPGADLPESMISYTWGSRPDLEAQRLLETEVKS